MKILDDIVEKIDEWEEAAKEALGVSDVSQKDRDDIEDYIRQHHAQELKDDIDRLDAEQATIESRLDDELISPEAREDVEHLLDTLDELRERLKDLL